MLDTIRLPQVKEVEAYYDKETDAYLSSYGDIIQASRPISNEGFIDYLIASMGIEDGMKLLDAGCGVCGPSIKLAEARNVEIDALTLSGKQVQIAQEQIRQSKLESSISVKRGDYHKLDEFYERNSYDVVFFLEALGYSSSFERVLQGAYNVLKPYGYVYVKDYFPLAMTNNLRSVEQLEIIKQIRSEYQYRLLDLPGTITKLREIGFLLHFVRRMGFVEDFGNALNFEMVNNYKSYTRAINTPYQVFEALELKFQKIA
jgi:ubiquinone/menaquinone biosynthesis C-methylase UbiE